MSFNIGKYNRYVTYQSPTDVNTKGSPSRTYTTVFTGYAQKIESGGDSPKESGKRTTISNSRWLFPYNEAIAVDGRFYEGNATSNYYYVVNIMEVDYQTELEVEVELRR